MKKRVALQVAPEPAVVEDLLEPIDSRLREAYDASDALAAASDSGGPSVADQLLMQARQQIRERFVDRSGVEYVMIVCPPKGVGEDADGRGGVSGKDDK